MTQPPDSNSLSQLHIQKAVQQESKKFEEFYLWLESHMPPSFFEEVDKENIMLITHSLMRLNLQDFFAHIHLKHEAFAICLDSPNADLKILKHYRLYGIKHYRAFVSNEPPPFEGIKTPLRIATISFTEFAEKPEAVEEAFPEEKQKEVLTQVKARNPEVTDAEFRKLIHSMSPRFLKAMTKERLIMAIDMYFRSKTRDHCQYEDKIQ